MDNAQTNHPALGPWAKVGATVVDGSSRRTVALCLGDDALEVDRIGHLIAAAPELLEVLKTTAGNIRSLAPAGALDGAPWPYKHWLAAVDAAIAKATEGAQ